MNIINTLFSKVPNSRLREISKSLSTYDYVLIENDIQVDGNMRIDMIFVNNKDDVSFCDTSKIPYVDHSSGHCIIQVCIPVTEYTQGWYECRSIRVKSHVPVLVSDLGELEPISTDRTFGNIIDALYDDLTFDEDEVDRDKSSEFLKHINGINIFRCELILSNVLMPYGEYSTYLYRLHYLGKCVAYVSRSGKYGDDYCRYVTDKIGYGNLTNMIEVGVTLYRNHQDVPIYKKSSEADFLPLELESLLENGIQENTVV
mgnify:CR=1 FL=1